MDIKKIYGEKKQLIKKADRLGNLSARIGFLM